MSTQPRFTHQLKPQATPAALAQAQNVAKARAAIARLNQLMLAHHAPQAQPELPTPPIYSFQEAANV